MNTTTEKHEIQWWNEAETEMASYLEDFGSFHFYGPSGNAEDPDAWVYSQYPPTLAGFLDFLDRDHMDDETMVTPSWREELVNDQQLAASLWEKFWSAPGNSRNSVENLNSIEE